MSEGRGLQFCLTNGTSLVFWDRRKENESWMEGLVVPDQLRKEEKLSAQERETTEKVAQGES